MSSRHFIYSTLTADQLYTDWTVPPKGGVAVAKRQVLVKGGANVADRNKATPRGVCTEVSAEEMASLQSNSTYLVHRKNGFITEREEKVDPEVAVAADMAQKDKSAPLSPESTEFEEAGGAKPKKKDQDADLD